MRQHIDGTCCPNCNAVFVNMRQLVVDKPLAPSFYSDKKQLETVLLARLWSYVHGGRFIFDNEFRSLDIRKLNEEATVRALNGYKMSVNNEQQKAAMEKHIQAVKHFGGVLEYHHKIADIAWGAGWNAKDVALFFGLTPASVRQTLSRIVLTAGCLGFDITAVRREACAVCGQQLGCRSISLHRARAGNCPHPNKGVRVPGSQRWKREHKK